MLPFASLSLIAGLPEDLKKKIYMAGVKSKYAPGQYIHLEGDATVSLSIILKGSVRISRSNAEGEDIAAVVLKETETFGEHPLFAGIARTHDATALSDVTIIDVSKTKLFQLIDKETKLRDHLFRTLTYRVIRALELLDDERRHPVRLRVAKLLRERCVVESGYTQLRLTQSGIAEALDVSRVSVSTAIRLLKSKGIVQSAYGAIAIPEIEKLDRWINCQSV